MYTVRSRAMSCRPERSDGFTLIELMIVIAISAIVSGVAIPDLHRQRMASNENTAVESIGEIREAQDTFTRDDPDRDFVMDASSSLLELGRYDLIEEDLGQGTKSGYGFVMTTNNAPDSYEIVGVPLEQGSTGRRSFWSSEEGTIRYSTTGPANADSQPVPPTTTTTTTLPDPKRNRQVKAAAKLAKKLDKLADGSGIAQARALLDDVPAVNAMIGQLDPLADSRIDLMEVLGMDFLTVARNLGPTIDPSSPEIGDDAKLIKVIGKYQQELIRQSNLGNCEPPFPDIDADRLDVTPAKVLLDGLVR